MTARLVAELWCDRCPNKYDNDSGEPDVNELRRDAEADGWTCSPGYADMIDFCPSCTKVAS